MATNTSSALSAKHVWIDLQRRGIALDGRRPSHDKLDELEEWWEDQFSEASKRVTEPLLEAFSAADKEVVRLTTEVDKTFGLLPTLEKIGDDQWIYTVKSLIGRRTTLAVCLSLQRDLLVVLQKRQESSTELDTQLYTLDSDYEDYPNDDRRNLVSMDDGRTIAELETKIAEPELNAPRHAAAQKAIEPIEAETEAAMVARREQYTVGPA